VGTLQEFRVSKLQRFGGGVLNKSKRPKAGTTWQDFGVRDSGGYAFRERGVQVLNIEIP
jgi:hypothetical protein